MKPLPKFVGPLIVAAAGFALSWVLIKSARKKLIVVGDRPHGLPQPETPPPADDPAPEK